MTLNLKVAFIKPEQFQANSYHNADDKSVMWDGVRFSFLKGFYWAPWRPYNGIVSTRVEFRKDA